MIYFYRHKRLNEFSQEEIDMLGYDGVKKFAEEHNLDSEIVFNEIKSLEKQIEQTKFKPLDMNSPNVKQLLDKGINQYVDFFNKNANYNKQAYVIVGNIGSGKSTYANMIEEDTHSIIIDSDRFKSGELTPHGFFEGLSSLYSLEEREKLQKPCSIANSMTADMIASTGMNIIIPTATKSEEHLNNKINALIKNNYDIHLIYIDAPYPDLADRAYFRYLVQEFEQKRDPNGNIIHGRFVPISIIKNYGEPCHDTFAKAFKQRRFKSFKALYNDKTTNESQEIDLSTMQL